MTEPRRRLGIRARITSVAVAVVAIALIAGAVGFWFTLRSSLLGQLEVAARQDATAWAEQVDDAGLESLPDVDDDRFWQVIDRETGGAIEASDVAEDLGALADREGSASGAIDIPGEGVFVIAADAEDGDRVVVAGRSTADSSATLASVATLLAVSVPLIVLVVGFTTWIAVGRALAPVDRLRGQVDAVTASDLSRRVDDPHTTDEVGRLARTMNGMLARLETAQRSQRRFISDASHELKSPLAVLRQYAEVALAHPERVSPRLLADTVLGEGARLERLVQGMLVLAKADENALVLDVAEVDLDDILFAEGQRVRATTSIVADGSGIRPVRARADAGLVAQAVRNLVDNAVRHAAGRVALSTAQADGSAMVIVEDDGPGVPAAERARVWERFVRLDEARSRDAGGSGLGLAIVAEIARAHGGSVRLDDAALGGARFTLILPV
jgi:signal transduction histidine kinase